MHKRTPRAMIPVTHSLAFFFTLAGTPPHVHVSDDALIKAIMRAVGDRTFNSRELKELARVAGPLRDILGDMIPAQIGKALQKLKGKNYDGYVLERQSVDKEGTMWRVFFRG